MAEGVVVQDVHGAQQKLTGEHFWSVMERIIPRALTPVAVAARAEAPRGRSGKLTGRPFEVRTRRQFVLGTVLDAAIGTGVSYGHLPERGFRIIPRGPQRKGRKLMRGERASLRSGLIERRTSGAIGQVPGQFFVKNAWDSREQQTKRLIEALLALEMSR